MDEQAEDTPTKLDLPFILNATTRRTRRTATNDSVGSAAPPFESDLTPATSDSKRLTQAEKKRKRTCTVDGCDNYIVHKGLCCRHGGGKKCTQPGCTTSAKHNGLCWKHGGSVVCKVDKCTRKAKARGLCWSHGGGTKCQRDECDKVAVSNGFCWAHGGGKRCVFPGCIRPGYERTNKMCPQHHRHQQQELLVAPLLEQQERQNQHYEMQQRQDQFHHNQERRSAIKQETPLHERHKFPEQRESRERAHIEDGKDELVMVYEL